MAAPDSQPWFASWFDSPYYPILYQHRDLAEADRFVGKLLDALAPAAGSYFLDLACGRGRHAQTIHRAGFRVMGTDLSPASIADARKAAGEGLQFEVADMRDPFPDTFDYIFNLFTSFGYFEDSNDNLKVLANVHRALRPGGTLVLDYLNAHKVQRDLMAAETKGLDGITFEIQRSIQGEDQIPLIVKDIEVIDGEQRFQFQERVQAISAPDFERLLEQAGLQVVDRWGDYDGHAFDKESSPRLIHFCQRKERPA